MPSHLAPTHRPPSPPAHTLPDAPALPAPASGFASSDPSRASPFASLINPATAATIATAATVATAATAADDRDPSQPFAPGPTSTNAVSVDSAMGSTPADPAPVDAVLVDPAPQPSASAAAVASRIQLIEALQNWQTRTNDLLASYDKHADPSIGVARLELIPRLSPAQPASRLGAATQRFRSARRVPQASAASGAVGEELGLARDVPVPGGGAVRLSAQGKKPVLSACYSY